MGRGRETRQGVIIITERKENDGLKEGGSGAGSGSGCFQGRLMGFADGLDMSCEKK